MVLAISAGNHNALRYLRYAKVKLNAECSWGEHPVTTAIFIESKIFKLPMENYQPWNNRPGPMNAACFKGRIDLILLLHNKCVSVTTTLSYNSQENIRHINSVYSTYTEDSVAEWRTLRTPLQVALYRKHVATALMILDLGGNEFDGDEIVLAARIGSSALIHALFKGNNTCFRRLYLPATSASYNP
ncbi:hypothetical protein GGR51DRAFT_507608 [Nemania sp. FL0031]|nr:hypothetical protein GGR51DRAFT_507608 [Nemania sp. FL0031]